MIKITFYDKEEGDVDIFNIPIDEHRQLCATIKTEPSVYINPFRRGMFYRHASMKVSGVFFNFYSEDTPLGEAVPEEATVIAAIQARQAKQKEVVAGEDEQND